MEAPGGAKAPVELKKGAQNQMKPSLSGEHNPAGVEERGFSVPIAGLLQVTERRQPLSSVSSLEVHFDLLDLTELTDMSDQELAEVFADSDEENHNQSPTSNHQPSLGQGGYMRSPSWTRCSKGDQSRERKQQSDSESAESFLPREKRKEP